MFAKNSKNPASESLRTFMTGLFDYAGLFPPALLPMPEAVVQYAAHLRSGDKWMTGPFVCTIRQIDSLIAQAKKNSDITPIEVSLLPRPPIQNKSFLDSFSGDIEHVRELVGANPGVIQPVMLEMKVPPECLNSVDELVIFLSRISSMQSLSEIGVTRLFIEVVRTDRYKEDLETVCAAVHSLQSGPVEYSLKIRCGGMDVADYPSSSEIAVFLATVIGASCSFKATAGLHHPIRHFNTSANAVMHGFLNVFFAAILYSKFRINHEELLRILNDENQAHFEFVNGELKYMSWTASESEIEHVRSESALSIGSCSILEPVQDLVDLGLFIEQ